MATVSDLDAERMAAFLSLACSPRAFPLAEEATPTELVTHLNLLNRDRPTHASVFLFGKHPQRFMILSEVRCAHFHGTEVTKPIPSYQVYKGTVFELVDQAVDFVMSKVNLAVGTRAESTQTPVAYEIPLEVVREAIVNAVAHRDYTSNGSVQVMLFSDRLEVWNPGTIQASLTLEMLRRPHGSVPGNPLLAEGVEERGLTKRNTDEAAASPTQDGESASNGLERVRRAAQRKKGMRFTSLLHHVTLQLLADSYYALKRNAAPGVDGMRWKEYEEDLQTRIGDLHERIHRGNYRALPSRRTYIPKADGRQRALGIASLEDKIVQQAIVTI